MQFEKARKIECCTAKEAGRFAMNHLYFYKRAAPVDGRPALVATDGRILVVVPVTDAEWDVEGLIPTDCVKAAAKAARRGEVVVHAPNGQVKVLTRDGMVSTLRPDEGEYPDVWSTFPGGTRGWHRFGIDAEQLLKVQRGMGAKTVVISVKPGKDSRTPYVVEPRGGCEGGIGLVMPVTLEE